MFKSGDRVKIVWAERYSAADNFIYDIVTIDRAHLDYSRSKHWHVISDTKAQFCVKEEWLELVKEEKITATKYKIGDRVRYLGGNDDQFIGIGDMCTVTSLSNTGVRGKWNNPTTGKIHYGDGNWHAESTDIELVKDTTMKITLPNGMTLEGSTEQIHSTAKLLGYGNVFDPSKFYKSSHMGMILIADMKSDHVKNALLKMYRAWVESLSGMTPSEVAMQVTQGPNDKTFIALFQELSKRK